MNKFEYKEFIKRYDKFEKNNLPTPFWDEERQTFEYVYFSKKEKKHLEISPFLTDALGKVAFVSFYYPFTDRHMKGWIEDGKLIWKAVTEHNHAHSFEEVVQALYRSPESFNIMKDEEQFYSMQELKYLRRVQKYLLFIGMKDLETRRAPVNRYRNKIHSKYENVCIYKLNDEYIREILEGKIDFMVVDWYQDYSSNRIYKPKEYRALIVNEEDNFKMFIEFTREELVKYKDVKNVYKRNDLKDNDKLITVHFKILEIF